MQDGAETTKHLVYAGFETTSVYLTDVFPWRASNRPLGKTGCVPEEVRVRSDHPRLYSHFLSEHVTKSLASGGEVTLVFGIEAKAVFEEPEIRKGVSEVIKAKQRYKNVEIDAEIWVYEGMWSIFEASLHILEGNMIARRLLIYVPHPAALTYPRNPVTKANLAKKLDYTLEWISSFVDGTTFTPEYFINFVRRRQPDRAAKDTLRVILKE